MQELFIQFSKSLLAPTDSSALVKVLVWIKYSSVNTAVANFTLSSYAVWLFMQEFVWKEYIMAIDLFRLLLGWELGLVLEIIGLSLQILTSELGSLILQDAGHSGLSPAKHSGCWLAFKILVHSAKSLGLHRAHTPGLWWVTSKCLQDWSQFLWGQSYLRI